MAVGEDRDIAPSLSSLVRTSLSLGRSSGKSVDRIIIGLVQFVSRFVRSIFMDFATPKWGWEEELSDPDRFS